MNSQSIAQLQVMLRYIEYRLSGSTMLPVDGIYGEDTRNAVTDIQNRVGFVPTGEVDTDTLDIQLLGAGNVEFDNIVCDNAYFFLRGAGNIEVDNITSQNTEIQLMGVGEADVNFVNSGNLKCVLRGVGNIDVEGDVRTFTKSVSGTGSIDADKLRVGG